MTIPTKWHAHPAKTQISLGICPVWSVFVVRMNKAWVLSYRVDAQADLSLLWAHSHFVGFVMRRLNFENRLLVKVGWLCWGLTSQSTIFQSCRDGAIASWVINQYFRGVKCLAQGHNTAAVGLEPRTSRSGVRHSTTEPPRSPFGKGVVFADTVEGMCFV